MCKTMPHCIQIKKSKTPHNFFTKVNEASACRTQHGRLLRRSSCSIWEALRDGIDMVSYEHTYTIIHIIWNKEVIFQIFWVNDMTRNWENGNSLKAKVAHYLPPTYFSGSFFLWWLRKIQATVPSKSDPLSSTGPIFFFQTKILINVFLEDAVRTSLRYHINFLEKVFHHLLEV